MGAVVCKGSQGPGIGLRTALAAAALLACGMVAAQGYPSKPIRLIVTTAAGGLMDVAARVATEYLSKSLGQRIAYDIRNDIYDHMQRLSYAYHDQMETGQIMSRSTQDVENIRMFVAQALFRTVYIAVLMVVGIGLMFTMNVTLALVSMVTMPIVVWRSRMQTF